MTQRIDRHMRLAAFTPFGSIVTRAFTTFWAGLQRTTVENGGGGGGAPPPPRGGY
jgi:hypothetical protein